jgi:XTP/dITP diphosphohydrolase
VLTVVEPTGVPGAFGWPAWEALRRGPVLVGSAEHPSLPALAEAGITWEVVDAPRDGCVWLSGGEAVEGEVIGSAAPVGIRLLDAVAVMDRLRSPGGCPWDAKQTHESLMPYLLEEAYETYEALENGDHVELREELGDLLLQILFHARIAEDFGIDEVSGDLVDKLVRRHPHVFAGASADDLEGSWERLKQAEKGRASVTEGVPLGQPALALAAKLQRRAAKLGAPTVAYDGLGGRLWELVAQCADAGLDPEVELRTVARAFRDRLAALEASGLPTTEEGWRAAFA